MNALEARKTTDNYLAKVEREHEIARKKLLAKEHKQTAALWEKRGPAPIAQIDGYIRRAAAKGGNGTWEPTNINPNGDSVIYLDGEDQLVKELLMDYFRNEGFTVTDYMYGGLKITW